MSSTTAASRSNSRLSWRTTIVVGAAATIIAAVLLVLLGPKIGMRGAQSGDQGLLATLETSVGSGAGALGDVSVARITPDGATFAGQGIAGRSAPDENSYFELASVTKTFTGMLLGVGMSLGEMQSGDSLSTYIPELAGTPAGEATLFELATHTSGLPSLPQEMLGQAALAAFSNDDPYGDIDVAAVIQMAADEPVSDRGTYAYSNLGFALLGEAEVRAAGAANWPSLATERLLTPLGMTSTTFAGVESLPPGADVRTPHLDNGWPTPHWFAEGFSPAGVSTLTTTADLARLAQAILDGSAPGLVATDQATTISEDGTQGIGLAWMVTAAAGNALLWHNGSTSGTTSMAVISFTSQSAAIVLNTSPTLVDNVAVNLLLGEAVLPVEAAPNAIRWALMTGGLIALLGAAVLLWRANSTLRLLNVAALSATSALAIVALGPWAQLPSVVGMIIAAIAVGVGVASLVRMLRSPLTTERTWLTALGLAGNALVLGVTIWML